MALAEVLICLALNVYHEARGEPPEGREAVAHVVLNRVEDPRFPDTVCRVILQGGETLHGCQFSWYCDGRPDEPTDSGAWLEAKAVASRVLSVRSPVYGPVLDPTFGALYYHSTSVSPWWTEHFDRTVTIDGHIFYRRSR